jgi:hypothetical protein
MPGFMLHEDGYPGSIRPGVVTEGLARKIDFSIPGS